MYRTKLGTNTFGLTTSWLVILQITLSAGILFLDICLYLTSLENSSYGPICGYSFSGLTIGWILVDLLFSFVDCRELGCEMGFFYGLMFMLVF